MRCPCSSSHPALALAPLLAPLLPSLAQGLLCWEGAQERGGKLWDGSILHMTAQEPGGGRGQGTAAKQAGDMGAALQKPSTAGLSPVR